MSIKHETIEVRGTVIYCDECGERGPGTAYDNIEDTLECAMMKGWTRDPDNDERDLCKVCSSAKSKQPQRDGRKPGKKK